MNNKKILLTCLSAFVLLALLSSGAGFSSENEDVPENTGLQELVKEADRIAREARTETRTEERLRDAIALYKRVLGVDPDNQRALTRLSLGYFTLAEAYLSSPKETKSAYRKGYEYGLKGLKSNEEFAELYEEVGRKALKNLPESIDDVEAFFWPGANLGRLAESKGVLDSLGDLPVLVALNRQVVELDEAYLGGGGHRALGSIAGELLSKLPFSLLQVNKYDLSWEKTKEHFERAIELAPTCLENYFSYAKYYALKKGDKEMARSLLDKVLDRPVGSEYPLINRISKEKARDLKKRKFN